MHFTSLSKFQITEEFEISCSGVEWYGGNSNDIKSEFPPKITIICDGDSANDDSFDYSTEVLDTLNAFFKHENVKELNIIWIIKMKSRMKNFQKHIIQYKNSQTLKQ
ncbi:hypothetical protein FGO68_gene2156 [Halteria grandinella]|uniref:Uncharacterized protein n=1 Tax=Halteria grandinella TaxID=5974 RepID=A0A8J8T332_HALGN|nr:hypothetical protein FGO68_gene2156 [Halteria grandinella]